MCGRGLIFVTLFEYIEVKFYCRSQDVIKIKNNSCFVVKTAAISLRKEKESRNSPWRSLDEMDIILKILYFAVSIHNIIF